MTRARARSSATLSFSSLAKCESASAPTVETALLHRAALSHNGNGNGTGKDNGNGKGNENGKGNGNTRNANLADLADFADPFRGWATVKLATGIGRFVFHGRTDRSASSASSAKSASQVLPWGLLYVLPGRPRPSTDPRPTRCLAVPTRVWSAGGDSLAFGMFFPLDAPR